MTMEKENKQKIELFLTKYPETIEFTRQSKEFQHAHAKLFELIEYVLNHSKDLTPEDEKFKKHWESWKQNGLNSQQSLTVVKRRMDLQQKGCIIQHYTNKVCAFARLKQFIDMEYVTKPQPLMRLTNKYSTKPTPKTKQSTLKR